MTVTVLRSKAEDPELTISVSRDAAPVRLPPRTAAARLPGSGDIVGNKYRIEGWLGQGGMGAVFRATQLVSEKQVALKWMLRPQSHPQARARFLREARAAGRIHHPNVVDVYDVGEEAEYDFLVMELLRGESLRARLDRGALRVGETVDLLLPAMLGVAAAHRAGVIHRDLKPDNVFLCEGGDGQEGEAKVLDFGISQITSSDVGDTITRDGAVLGTPSYMSPEQLKDARNVDVRTDVYSLAVIFYEAITGRLPFCDTSYAGIVLAIAQTEAPAPSTLVKDVPRAFEQVLRRAMARDRDQRYPDLDSFVAAVRPFGTRHAGAAFVHGSAPALRGGTVSNARADEQAWPEAPASPALASPASRSAAAVRSSPRRPALGVAALVALLLVIWWVGQSGAGALRSPAASRAAATAANQPAAAHVIELVSSSSYTAEQHATATGSASTAIAAAQGEQAASARVEVERSAAAAAVPRARPVGRARAAAPRTHGARGPSQPIGRSGTISLDDM